MLLVVLILEFVVAVLVGRSFAEDRSESALLWKLVGYAFLGLFTFTLNDVTLPLGYVIALILAARCRVNARARRAAATVTFLIWLIGLLVNWG